MGRRKSLELSNETKQRVTLAAELYYIYHLTQHEIAAQLGVSRVWVGKLLQKAEELGIVRININTASAGIQNLENALKEKYNLKCAKVVRYAGEEVCKLACARAAASYLASVLRHGDCVSTLWGTTLAAMVNEFVPLSFPDVTVVPFIGGLGFHATVLPNQIAFALAKKLSANAYPLHAPGYVASRKERDLLLRDPAVSQAIELSHNADILIIGTGPLRNSTLMGAECISEQEFAELEALGAVGDVASFFLDSEGNIVDHPIHQRMVSADLSIVRAHVREAIVVTFGTRKADILRAALAGHWADTVVTDENTARAVLYLDSSENSLVPV